ncbi:MAG: hypothetical protein HOC71_03315 [Candidatus Latescibacteria bacterium]|nr:hypothetical protein [Candidatus Latescibacterota bacterium]
MFTQNKDYRQILLKIVLSLLLAVILLAANSDILKAQEHTMTANIQIWDTLSPFQNQIDLNHKTGWKAVPVGNVDAYSPKGDIIIENEFITAVFSSKSGKVIIYSNYCESLLQLHRGYLKIRESGKKRMELIPLQFKGKEVSMASCKIFSKTANEATVEVNYSVKEAGRNLTAIFSFNKKQIIEVQPTENMKGMSFSSLIEFAIVPNFISDDLIFDPRNYSSNETLEIPSENIFSGLLRGKDSMLIITWPEGKQEIKLITDNENEKGPLFGSVDFKNDGKSFYLAILDAPRIWHKEEIKPSYLEKDIAVRWNRPFHAKWITQLYEDGIKTTFPFIRPETPYFRGEAFFRSGLGTYTYPLWFKSEHLGERPYYRLGKKIPPKGDSIIYFLEGRDNIPVPVSSPVDILKQTLDNQTCEDILDSEGRLTRSLRRPGVICNSATCHVTGRLKSIFQAGRESEEEEIIIEGIKDLLDFVEKENERGLEYQNFAQKMVKYLALMKRDKPGLKTFLDKMESITKEIITVYDNEKENLKNLEYAGELARETEALIHKKSPDNFEAFMKLTEKWTGMGGAIDDLNRKHHTLTRKLFQEAGYSCVTQHENVKIAEEIRTRAIKCLRRPNRYEIWTNY